MVLDGSEGSGLGPKVLYEVQRFGGLRQGAKGSVWVLDGPKCSGWGLGILDLVPRFWVGFKALDVKQKFWLEFKGNA